MRGPGCAVIAAAGDAAARDEKTVETSLFIKQMIIFKRIRVKLDIL